MMSQGFEDEGEVHIREIVFGSQSQVYDPIPSQWTLSQRDDRSPPFPLPRRKERIQHERIGFNSPQSESDNSLSHENDFANLEALLEDQQKVSATCIKNDASIAEKDDKPVGSTAKSPNVDPEEDTALACPAHLRSTSNDDVADNNLTDVSGLMEHLPKRQSTFRLRAETGICEPSRSNAYANRSGVVDPTSRRLPCKLPTAMVSSLLDSTSLNHSSILEKSRKMAAQSMKQRPTRIFKEGRSNSMLASIAGPRYVNNDQLSICSSICVKI